MERDGKRRKEKKVLFTIVEEDMWRQAHGL
jgi:hypothetical protein